MSSAKSKNFRDYLRSPDDPRIAGIANLDAYSWADHVTANPRAGPLFSEWRKRYLETEFYGVTTNGKRIDGLFELGGEHAPVGLMVRAANSLLSGLTPAQEQTLCHELNARQWRAWMNPEVYMQRYGLRLEEVDTAVRERILAVVQASMSESGFQKVRDLMRMNHFLGELVGGQRVLNEYSYNFNLFGKPGTRSPWGWNFYGHHVCLNCLVIGEQMVFTPVFFGAEPEHIDNGPHEGLRVLQDEERLGLELMRSLDPVARQRAHLYHQKRDPKMPPGRVAIADELHLCGAFQDNRVIPLEGALAGDFSPDAQQRLLGLISAYLSYLPAGPLNARMRQIGRMLDETWFCWIGGTNDDSPFYYRIQSPVIIIEFDHHAGVFLANSEPKKFHIHTLIRTPNGNDYGKELLRRVCQCGATQQ